MMDAKRAFSLVWDHFNLVTPKKVQCSLCSQRLSFNKNTSAMLRHLRAKHPSEAWYGISSISSSALSLHTAQAGSARQKELDEVLVNMLVRDSHPFSMVEDKGFNTFVQKLDPNYILPSKQALKKLVATRCQLNKERVVREVANADFVSLTADTWTCSETDSCVSVTGHFVTEDSQLSTFLLGIAKLPENHKPHHVEEAKNQMMARWAIHGKVATFVTEAGESMVASVQKLGILQLPSFGHILDLVVRRSMEGTPALEEIRTQARTIVGFFKASATAQERLAEVQGQLNRPGQTLAQEVAARWTSTFCMLERLFDQRESVAAALSTLDTDIIPLGSADYEAIHQCLGVLKPFHQATAELSAEKRVSASKVIPLVLMLKEALAEKRAAAGHPVAALLASNLQGALEESCGAVETEQALAAATLLDPRFKVLAFGHPGSAQEAVKLLTLECATLIRFAATNGDEKDPPSMAASTAPTSSQGAPRWPTEAAVPKGGGLWELFDSKVGETQSVQSSTADAAVEVQRYLSDAYLNRGESPTHFWERHRKVYPHLFQLARKYLSIPATSVPCERLFSKAGEAFAKRRSQLGLKAAEQVMLLNDGLL